MDLSGLIALLPTQYIPYVTAAITIAGILCTIVPAPTTTSGLWYEVYQIINRVALNFGHAKSLSAPESTGIVGGPGAVSAPAIATSTVPLATATPEQKAVMVPPVAPPATVKP